jgi:hypothetical protein
MNYIKHLNGFFLRLDRDQRLTAHHISLYLAIFQLWNIAHFQDSIYASRDQLMKLSRIGGRNTYAKCMKDLHRWGYIRYFSTRGFFNKWMIQCVGFDADCPEEIPSQESNVSAFRGLNNDTTCSLKNDTCSLNSDTGIRLKTDTDTDLKSDTGKPPETLVKTGPTEDPINKTNKINIKKKKKKKKSPKIFLIKREESTITKNPYHVENDKNYAEPL